MIRMLCSQALEQPMYPLEYTLYIPVHPIQCKVSCYQSVTGPSMQSLSQFNGLQEEDAEPWLPQPTQRRKRS